METDIIKKIYEFKSQMRSFLREWAVKVSETSGLSDRMNSDGYYEFPNGGFPESGNGRIVGWKPRLVNGICTDVDLLGVMRDGAKYPKSIDYLDTDTLCSIYGAAKGGIYYSYGKWI